MSDYTNFEVEDFLMDEGFINWVKRPDDKSNLFWKEYLAQHPEKKSSVEKAVVAIKSFTDQTYDLPDTFYSSLKNDIDTTISNGATVKKLASVYKLPTWIRVAAAILLVAVSVSMLYLYFQSNSVVRIETAYKQVKTVELPDHSLVTLNANSSLEYSKQWNNNNREVTLKGEGFFKITHIEQQRVAAKFTVHADKVNVEVLGTEFNVRSRDHLTGVMLQSGKVQLHIYQSNVIHTMQPNDFVSFNATTKKINKVTVNPTYYTAWLNRKYIFSKASLKEVCNHLENFYGLKFKIENTVLGNQEISGTLMLEDESSLLQTLSSILNANVAQQGQTITISSK